MICREMGDFFSFFSTLSVRMGERAFEMSLAVSVSEAGAGMTCGVGKQRWPDQNALTRSKL